MVLAEQHAEASGVVEVHRLQHHSGKREVMVGTQRSVGGMGTVVDNWVCHSG